jgi:hypothetical protein
MNVNSRPIDGNGPMGIFVREAERTFCDVKV